MTSAALSGIAASESAGPALTSVRERIRRAAESSGRRASDVQLIAVSKKQPAARIAELYALGQQVFGENYVQEAKSKIQELAVPGSGGLPSFHLIGHLQRNKARDAVRMFHVIQSVDRLELAAELAREAEKVEKRQKILLQIKLADEESKSGCEADKAEELLRESLALPALEVLGLMGIGRFDIPEPERRQEFRFLSGLREKLRGQCGAALPELSMGMSEDFELAIREGATIVRVGTAIFGARE